MARFTIEALRQELDVNGRDWLLGVLRRCKCIKGNVTDDYILSLLLVIQNSENLTPRELKAVKKTIKVRV